MALCIRINEVGDPPSFPELSGKLAHEGRLQHVAILQGGMESGRTSVSFFVTLPDGKVVLAQLSADLLKGVVSAINGAEERWKEAGK